MTRHFFDFDQAKADAIRPHDAVRLLEALRLPGEGIWLQTFSNGPQELYSAEQKVSKAGKPYTVLSYCVSGIPKQAGKSGRQIGRTDQTGDFTLEEMAGAPYRTANRARCGVFFAVNVLQPDAQRRSNDTVGRVAAVFLDLDGAPLPERWPLPPTAMVESSPGRFHVYWAVSDLPLSEFTTLQKHLAAMYGGDESVSDLARVMRLPGYWHGKQEPGALVELRECDRERHYTRDDLLTAFPGLPDALTAAERAEEERRQRAADQQARAAELRAEVSGGTVTSQADAQRKYGQAALLDEVGKLASAGQGGRNNQLFKSAAALGECVAAGVLDLGTVEAELRSTALAVGLDQHETETTLQSGLAKGAQNPRDLSKVGQLVGKKRAGPAVGRALASAVARVEVKAAATMTAEEIPEPEGEGGSYSDGQLLELLALPWPVVGLTTDRAHSYRLKDHAGDDLGFVPQLGGYVAWDGRQWLSGGKDGAGQVEAKRKVQELGVYMRPEVERLLSLYGVLDLAAKRAAQEHGTDSKEFKSATRRASAMEKAYYEHGRAARSTEADAKQKAVLSSARTLYVKDVRLFEPQPWLVGFQNGTWDHGTFREARREDHMLTLAAVKYQPDFDQGAWLEVLERITGGDADLALTLLDVAGYALSGAASLRLVPWLYGSGGTGKSTFAELLATVLGEMATTVDPKMLAADAARERLGAAIWGKRVATVAEAGNSRLDAEALKTLSGGDRLTVRMLYAEAFTARASHVLLMVANDAPRVEAYDEALKERVLALPFTHRLDKGPPLLGGKRVEETRQDPSSDLVRGFTAWAGAGLVRVKTAGTIHRAEVCKAATREFWSDVDPLQDFWLLQSLSEFVIDGVSVAGFRARYESWCQQTGGRAFTAHKFNKACLSVGLEQRTIDKERRWVLVEKKKYPTQKAEKTSPPEADQGARGEEDLEGGNGNYGISPNSPKPIFSSHTRKEENRFTENQSKSVISVASLEGEPLAPASGEL